MLTLEGQAFLQVISTRGVISDEELRLEAYVIFDQDCAFDMIQEINNRIKRYNLMIKAVLCEFTGKKYWVFTHAAIDKNMNFFGDYTKQQIEFAYKLFDEIVCTEDGHLSSIDCINFRNEMASGMSLTDVEALIKKLVDEMWLADLEGELYIGVRSIGGLIPYFMEHYAEGLKVCPLCSGTVFYGYKCDECNIVAHLYCLARALHFQKKSLKCMNCKADLPLTAEELPKVADEGEPMDASTNDDNASEVSRKSERKHMKSRKGSRGHAQ